MWNCCFGRSNIVCNVGAISILLFVSSGLNRPTDCNKVLCHDLVDDSRSTYAPLFVSLNENNNDRTKSMGSSNNGFGGCFHCFCFVLSSYFDFRCWYVSKFKESSSFDDDNNSSRLILVLVVFVLVGCGCIVTFCIVQLYVIVLVLKANKKKNLNGLIVNNFILKILKNRSNHKWLFFSLSSSLFYTFLGLFCYYIISRPLSSSWSSWSSLTVKFFFCNWVCVRKVRKKWGHWLVRLVRST
jgi:hypothetical protein